MAYQVLARKWRPHNFTEMVGQPHVVRALVNALTHQRLHHAYLFTGTRGVGKTTIARIFAKSLNCETNGITADPCGHCAACTEIDAGRFIDLIEVDAASRTKVEDTREILENVPYAPSRGRYKVYLIDEVHMLSKSSFNALLKTLEEPPPHVKFILATTDPQNLPATVLSRCLQFNLKRLPLELLDQHLTHILIKETIEFEVEAIRLIAHAAEGSVRDALSLLDQAIAYGGDGVRTEDIHAMLGTLGKNHVFSLLHALGSMDANALLDTIKQLAEYTPDYDQVLADLLRVLQQLALAHVAPDTLALVPNEREELQALTQQLSPEDVQLFYQIALTGRRDLPLAPTAHVGFEMLLLRMLTFRPVTTQATTYNSATSVAKSSTPPQPKPSSPPSTRPSPVPNIAKPKSENPAPPPMPEIVETTMMAPAPPPIPESLVDIESEYSPPHSNERTEQHDSLALTEENLRRYWRDIVMQLNVSGFVKQLANHCAFESLKEDHIHFILEPKHGFLRNKQTELEKYLSTYYKRTIHLHIRVQDATKEEAAPILATPALIAEQEHHRQQQAVEQDVAQDPFIVQMKEQCDAVVVEVKLKP